MSGWNARGFAEADRTVTWLTTTELVEHGEHLRWPRVGRELDSGRCPVRQHHIPRSSRRSAPEVPARSRQSPHRTGRRNLDLEVSIKSRSIEQRVFYYGA